MRVITLAENIGILVLQYFLNHYILDLGQIQLHYLIM